MRIAFILEGGTWIVLLVLLVAAAVVLLLRRNRRLRPGIDRAVARYWDTEQHSPEWERERRERERRQPDGEGG